MNKQDINLCPINIDIKFRTLVGWLIGKKHEITLSYGKTVCFFISNKIEKNKHWCTFVDNEVYEWDFINNEIY